MIALLFLCVDALWAQSGNAPAGPGFTSMLPMFVLMFVIIYFLMIRPNQKKQKKVSQMLSDLKKGDRVSTVGGILGTVAGIRDNVVVLKLGENTRIEFKKSAINAVINEKQAEKVSSKK